MAKFEIGEIAIAVGRGEPHECELIRKTRRPGGWVIRVPSLPSPGITGVWNIDEKNLRKKRPPEELGSWNTIRELTNANTTEETAEAKPTH